jgi:N-acetyl-gamma-glutamyl-phosphate reductase
MHAVHNVSVGIIGASGYSGIEATRILAAHPHVTLKFVTSDRWENDTVERRTGIAGPVGAMTYATLKASVALAKGTDFVLLATPAEVSLELVPSLLEAGCKIIDLSGAFRLKDASLYPSYYGFEHREAKGLEDAVYGLPELFREQVKGARLIANPGCYPTAAALSLAPLVSRGLLEDEGVIVNAASGVTGAGRKASEDLSFAEVNEDFRAYKVLKHQHGPEIAQTVSRVAKAGCPPLTFTAHLLPVKRGILVTTYARLRRGAKVDDAVKAFQDAYASEPFVKVMKGADEVNLKAVVGTNRCHVAVSGTLDGADAGRLVVTAAIDNLVKGAAGQAVQNLNLMAGFDEGTGLGPLRGFYP